MNGLDRVNSTRSASDQPHTSASTAQLTVVQMNRLIKAMGRDGFRDWFDDFRHGKAKETVEELMNVLDTIGEDLFRQYYFVKSALSAAKNTQSVALQGRANQAVLQQVQSPHIQVADPSSSNDPSGDTGIEMGQPPLLTVEVHPSTMVNSTNQATERVQRPTLERLPLAGSLSRNVKVEVDELVLELDGDSTAIPLIYGIPSSSDGRQVPIIQSSNPPPDAVSFNPAAVSPSLLAPSGLSSVECKKCGGEVSGDYKSRRAHVFYTHGPVEEATELGTQEALKKTVGECFPDSVVRNDLACNHPGCGKEVVLYKSFTGRMLQRSHVQQFHLALIAEDICPLSCPVRGCDKWLGARRDFHSLRCHLYNVHKGMASMSDEKKVACQDLFDRLWTATNNALGHFFPHTPKGALCVGVDVKKTDTPRAVRIENHLLRIGTGKPVSIMIEECEECGEAVSASYAARRQHAIEEHMEGGQLPQVALAEQQDMLQTLVRRCFPNAAVVNDLMCNRCGEELKDVAGRRVRELQRQHVQKHHFGSVEEAARIRCPVVGCSQTRYHISNGYALSNHIFTVHGTIQNLSALDRNTYETLRARMREATDELLPDCFPYTPHGCLTRKRGIESDGADDGGPV